MSSKKKLFQWKRDVVPALLVLQTILALAWIADSTILCLSYFSSDFLNADKIKFSPDFTAYYTAAKLFLQHTGGIYTMDDYKPVQEQIFHTIPDFKNTYLVTPLPFLNPPHSLLYFLPLAFLDFPFAYLSWALVNVALSIFLTKSIVSYFNIKERKLQWLTGLVVIGNSFWQATMTQGQLALVLAVSLMALLHACRNNKPWIAAICLIMLASKPNLFFMLAIPVIFSLPRKFFLDTVILGALVMCITAFVFSPDIFSQYYTAVTKANHATRGYGAGFHDMLNARKIVRYYFHLSFNHSLQAALVLLASATFALMAGWAYLRPAPGTPLFEILLSLTVAVNIFLSPWLHTHDVLILIIPAGIMLRYFPWPDPKAIAFTVVLYVLFISFYFSAGWILMQVMIIGGLLWQAIQFARKANNSL